ncbi:hypothetical protein D5282_13900 [bacterium 1xD8-48]|nr:hypothetical protein [bacterium 1xD8-48]
MKGKNFMALCSSLEGLSEQKQIDKIQGILGQNGLAYFKTKSSHGREMFYYIGKDTVFAVAYKPGGQELFYILIDCNIYEKYFKDAKGSFCLNKRNSGYNVKVHTEKYKGICLHRLVMREAGYKFEEELKDRQVDHVTCNTQINTLGELRVCTSSENMRNRKYCAQQPVDGEEADQFRYNPLKDFSVTWYAFVMHKMLGWGTARDMEDYNRDYILRNDKVAACYYRKILSP